MKLRPEFESIHGSLLNREVTPAFDVVLATVLRKETRIETQAAIESMPLPVVAYLHKNQLSVLHQEILREVSSAMNAMTLIIFTACSPSIPDVTKSTGSFPSRHDLERLIRDSIVVALPEAISSALSASS
ncbi:hypothetical protein H5410_047047, partial [Solanum commersonii]